METQKQESLDEFRIAARPVRQTQRAYPEHLLWKWLDLVRMTTSEFAKQLDVTRTTVSLWTHPGHRVSDEALALMDSLSTSLPEAAKVVTKIRKTNGNGTPLTHKSMVLVRRARAANKSVKALDGTIRLPRDLLDKIEEIRLKKEAASGKSWSKVMCLRWLLSSH